MFKALLEKIQNTFSPVIISALLNYKFALLSLHVRICARQRKYPLTSQLPRLIACYCIDPRNRLLEPSRGIICHRRRRRLRRDRLWRRRTPGAAALARTSPRWPGACTFCKWTKGWKPVRGRIIPKGSIPGFLTLVSKLTTEQTYQGIKFSTNCIQRLVYYYGALLCYGAWGMILHNIKKLCLPSWVLLGNWTRPLGIL